MFAKRIIEAIKNTEFDWRYTHLVEDKAWTVGEKGFVKNYDNVHYILTIDAKYRIIYDTYNWCHYEEVGKYNSDDELLSAFLGMLNKVEIVLFTRINGKCTYHKITSTIEDYNEAMETAKADLAKQGYHVLAVEFYGLKRIEPILYDETFDYNDIISCINSIYDFLSKVYEDRHPFETECHKNFEHQYKKPITKPIVYEKTLGMYNNKGFSKDGFAARDMIVIGAAGAYLGCIFASLYLLLYPSDEEEYAVSPKMLENIREKFDYHLKSCREYVQVGKR